MTACPKPARLQALWGAERKTRIRLQQWTVTLVVYLASAGVLAVLAAQGVLPGAGVAAWLAFVLAGLGAFYALIRSGLSRRFADPALTQWQIGFGVLTVLWGYWMSGTVRSAMLFALMVILTFGAFSLDWRRMATLTAFALAALAATMVLLHAAQPGRLDPMVDVANFLIAAVMLPASSTVAVILGTLRARLRQQRSELAAALEKIHELATHDDLTQLANRRHAQQWMTLEAQRGARSGRRFSLALVDLDHFKRINDRHGHGGGDAVLRRFAAEASASVRGCDLVARWGGEEFLILMPDTGGAAARRALERLRERVESLRVATHNGEARFTLSVGIVEHAVGEPVEHTLWRADRALYAAKAGGRNRCELHAPGAGAPP